MIEKLNRLLDLLIVIAENHAHPLQGADPTKETEMEKAERKVRKTRTPKVEVATVATAAVEAAEKIEDQLGLGPDPKTEEPKAMTEKESAEQLEPKTKAFITATKNEKPEDGKTRAIRMLNTDPRFMAGKLADLTHAQRVLWIAEMEKGLAGVK